MDISGITNSAMVQTQAILHEAKADGSFPIAAVRRLREMGAWISANDEAIYETSPVPINVDPNQGVYLTQKSENEKNYLYVTIFKPVENLELPIGKNSSRVIDAKVVETNQPVSFSQSDNEVVLTIPQNIFSGCQIIVVKIEIHNS